MVSPAPPHLLSPLAINQGHSCPDHTCVSENTRDPVMKDMEKLMHCWDFHK